MPRLLTTLPAWLMACHPVADPPTTPAAPAPATITPQPAAQVDADLDTMLGDDFHPDRLGLDAWEAIVARAADHADAHVQRLGERHLERARTDPRSLDLPVMPTLARLHLHAPDPATAAARRFLDAYHQLATRTDLDDRQRQRLRDATALAKILAGGLDRPLPATLDPVRLDRVCVAETPFTQGLLVEVDCACGDVLACRVDRRGDSLALTVTRVPAPQMCDDCFATWTTCTFKPLDANATVHLELAGRRLGTLTAGANGLLPAGGCLVPPAP
jgi:hypothetical protein